MDNYLYDSIATKNFLPYYEYLCRFSIFIEGEMIDHLISDVQTIKFETLIPKSLCLVREKM